MSLFALSCKKEPINNNDKYIIFNSDSSNVFGMILHINDSSIIYPNIAYKVTVGQIILFDRAYSSNANMFKLNIDIGSYEYYHPDNIHTNLVNQFIITIK